MARSLPTKFNLDLNLISDLLRLTFYFILLWFEINFNFKFKFKFEASTHYGTYSGVQGLALAGMVKVNPADKCAILNRSGELASPPEKLAARLNGVLPLWWQERKPVAFWRQFLADLDVKAVCDVTPGSGTLAKACLLENWAYSGITRTGAHSSFMQNKLDRDAVGVISMDGCAMYEADLAQHIKEHFGEIVEGLDAADVEDAESDFEEE